MTPTLRDRLLKVIHNSSPAFLDALYCPKCQHTAKGWCCCILDSICHAVQEAKPQLSREALVKILFPGGVSSTKESWLVDKIMAWARGEPTEPLRWCEHFERSSNEQEWIFTDKSEFQNCRLVRTVEWKTCPICVAPRPTER